MLRRRFGLVCVPWLFIGCASAPDAPAPAPNVELGQKADSLRVELGELLPTGARITPAAAEGSIFQRLNPGLPTRPDFVAGQAVATATSPDGQTLLILTSGYNRNNGPTGARIAAESNEYVFVYDIGSHPPVQK